VDVEVEDRLSGTGAHVEDRSVSLLDVALAGDFGGCEVAAANDFRVGSFGFFQSRKMFLRNDENVRGCLGIDVFEGEDVGVLVNFLSGYFAADDPAEKAVRGSVSHSLLEFLSDGE
jgi:hypothetical protein